MVSSTNDGSSAGANAPNSQQNAGDNVVHQAQGAGNPQAPATATNTPSARWQVDEEDWVLERFAENPESQWRDLIVAFNAFFAPRPPRNREAMRQHCRLWRAQLQARLNAQAGVSGVVAINWDDDEDENDGDDEEKKDDDRLGGILFEAVTGLKKGDQDDRGAGGSGKRGPGATGAPVAVS